MMKKTNIFKQEVSKNLHEKFYPRSGFLKRRRQAEGFAQDLFSVFTTF